MKNIEKAVKKQIQSNKKSAGGEMMRTHAVSDPRFSRVKSCQMFEEKEDEPEDDLDHKEKKEVYNPNKNLKPLKRMKNGGKKGK